MSNIIISPESGILEFNNNSPSGAAIGSATAPIRLDATGGNSFITGSNFGIGTNNPQFTLDVDGSIHGTSGNFSTAITVGGNPVMTGASPEADTLQTVTERGATSNQAISVSNIVTSNEFVVGNQGKVNSSSTVGLQLQSTSTNKPIIFLTNVAGQTERMRIQGDGKVGIGETAPEVKLEVAGDIMAKDSFVSAGATASQGYTFHDFGTGWGYKGVQSPSRLAMFTASAERVTIDADGKVGIGTTSPSQLLTLEGSSAAIKVSESGGAELRMAAGGSLGYVGTYNSNDLAILAGAGEKIRVKTDGKVGIGTTSPDSKLSVTSSTINSEDILYLKSGADNVDDYLGIAWELGVGGNGPHAAIRSFAGPSGSDARLGFLTTSNGGTTLTEGLSVAHNGNVGIGTTSPAKTLDIVGEIRTSGRATFNEYVNTSLVFGTTDLNLGYAGGTSGIFIKGSTALAGNVGINTTAPGTKLEVDQSANTYSSGFSLRNAANVIYGLYVDGSNNLNFHYQGSSKVVFESGGDVLPATNLGSNLGSSSKRFASIFCSGLSASSSVTTPTIQLQGNLKILNKAQTTYLDLAVRDTSDSEVRYNLNYVGHVSLNGELNFTTNGDKYIDVNTIANGNSFNIRHHNPTGNVFKTAFQSAANGATTLYYNGAARFATTTDGIQLYGNGYLDMPDNGRIRLGANYDLAIYHDGSNSYIQDTGSGGLRISSDLFRVYNADLSGLMINAVPDDRVELYFNDNKKLETTSSGITVTGGITLDGTGRIQGIDTVSSGTDATSKTYVDNAISSGIGSYLPLSGGTLTGNLTIGSDTNGKDFLVYGNATGEKLIWDASQSKLQINHDTDDFGVGIFTVSSASMTQPQLKVGRDQNQYWGVYTDDRNAHLVHRQDETSGNMSTRFDQWDSNTSDNNGFWAWRVGNGSGASMQTAMTLTQAGDLTLGGSLTLGGTGRIQGIDTVTNSTDAASKGYVDAQVGSADTLQEVTDNGNTTTNSVGVGTSSANGLLQVGKYTVASQGNQGTYGNLSSFANSDTDNIFLGLKNGSYPNRGFAFRTVAVGVNSDFTIYEHGQGSAEVFRITAGGNIGIGTTAPSRKFEIHENTTNLTIGEKNGYAPSVYGPVIETNANAITLPRDLYLAGSQANVRNISSVLTLNGDNGIAFRYYDGSSGQEGMRLTNAGNVGIGTTNPIASYDKVLNIQGSNPTVKIQTTSSSGWAYNQYVSPEATWSAGILDTDRYVISQSTSLGTNVRFTIDDATNGNVGIGTINPQNKLHVVGTRIRLDTNAGGFYQFTAGGGFRFALYDDSSKTHLFADGDGSNPHMTFNAGFVGIGTENPAQELHVKGTALRLEEAGSSARHLDIVPAVSGSNHRFTSTTTGSGFNFEYWNGSAATLMAEISSSGLTVSSGSIVLSGTGRIQGIDTVSASTDAANKAYVDAQVGSADTLQEVTDNGNTTTNSITMTNSLTIDGQGSSTDVLKLKGSARIQIENASATDSFYISNTGGSGASKLDLGGAVSIIEGGNVGVGVTNPSTKLQVGDGTADDVIRVYHSDSTYLNVRGYGLEYARSVNYIIPTTDTNKNLNIGYNALRWNDLEFNASGKFVFKNNTTELVRIKADGDVGIGTSGPTAKLDIVGDGADIFLQSADYKIARIQPRGTGANLDKGLFSLFDGSTEDVRIDTAGNSWFNGGNVGIGQGSPTAKLHLKGDGGTSGLTFKTTDFSNNETFYVFDGGRAGVRYSPFSIGIPSTTSVATNAVFQVEEAGLLTVLSTGKVGIGTTGPVAKLDVSTTGADGINLSQDTATSTISSRLFFSNATAGQGVSIYNSGSNMRFQTGSTVGSSTGTTRMVINSNGRVGIGTVSPSSLLHLEDAVSPTLQIKDTTNNVTFKAYAQDSNSHLANTSNHDLFIDTNNTSRITVKADGKVGINTGGSSLFNAFTVNGNANIHGGDGSFLTFNNGDANITVHYNGATTGRDLSFKTWNSTQGNIERMRLDKDGNLGIGTNSPKAKLHIEGDKSYSLGYLDATSDLHIGNDTMSSAVGAYAGSISFGSTNESNLQAASIVAIQTDTDPNEIGLAFFTQHSQFGSTDLVESMRISNDGNVGIGTTSPFKKLDLGATTSDTDIALNYSDVGTNLGQIGFALGSNKLISGDTEGDLVLRNSVSGKSIIFGTQSAERVRINSSGNIGIGTTNPQQILHLNTAEATIQFQSTHGKTSYINQGGGNFHIKASHSSGVAINYGDGNTALLNLYNNTTAAVSFRANGISYFNGGNVGIGTTSPSYKLHVSGTVGFTNQLYFTNNTAYIQVGSSWGNGVLNFLNGSTTAIQFDIPNNRIRNNLGKYLTDSSTTGQFGTLDNQSVAIVANNSTKMTILSGGNVGINKTSPAQKLDIGAGHIRLDAGYSLQWDNSHERIEQSDANLEFFVNNGQKVTINSDGIDVNGLTTANAFRSDANNTDYSILTRNSANNAVIYVQSANTNTNQPIAFFSYGSTDAAQGYKVLVVGKDKSYFDNTNVGIGTTNPIANLHIDGDVQIGNSNNPNSFGALQVNQASNVDEAGIGILSASAGRSIRIWVDETRSYINSGNGGGGILVLNEGAGNVGLGTISPVDKLHLGGSCNLLFERGGELRSKDTGGGVRTITRVNSANELEYGWSGAGPVKFMGGGSYTERMRIHTNGNVGIGITNPSQNLEVGTNTDVSAQIGRAHVGYVGFADHAGFAHLDIANTSSYALLQNHVGDTFVNSAASRHIYFRKGNTTIGGFNTSSDFYVDTNSLYVDASANRVGIGTNAPSQKLHVEGNIELTSGFEIGSNSGSYWQRIRTEDASASTTNAFNFETRNGSGSFIKHMVIRNDGNVGIGVTNPSYTLQVGGSIVGSSKSFLIKHPTKEGKKLLHACIEGPENGVYFRGKSTSSILEMPDYWIGLVHIDSMTVDITAIGPNQDLYVESIADDGEVTIGSNTEEPLNYFYVIYGERKDIDKLEIEILAPEYAN